MGLSPAQIQKAADLRHGLLRAAAQIILGAGVQALTLEGVAKQAGTSKGGLLHHFVSKTDLLNALLEDLIASFETDLRRHADSDPEPRGRQIRAYINAAAGSSADESRLGIAALTALLFDAAATQRWNAVTNQWFEQDVGGTDPVHCHILRLAADGLWLSEAFGMVSIDADQRAAAVRCLLDMTRS